MFRQKVITIGSLLLCICLFTFFCFGCTKDDIKSEINKVVGNGGQGGESFELAGEVTNALPDEQNTHSFGETITLEAIYGNEEYTVNKMTILDALEGKSFSFPEYPAMECGYVSKDGALSSDYIFVLVELTVKKVDEGEVKDEATNINVLSLVSENENGEILPVGDIGYFRFEESDSAKHVDNQDYEVYLDVGTTIDCEVGYFVPRSEVSNTDDLFFSLGIDPEKTQYIRQ